MKTLLLIDGNSILNRAFYGIRPLTNGAGLYTHAVYGMMNIILHHLEERKPDYAAVAFDRKAPTFRHLHYDGYKATRKGMPEELAVQLPYAQKAMEGLGLTILETDGFEADDILGTCSTLGDGDTEVFVLTGDRDAFQLIRDDVKVLLASTGETHVFDRAAFGEKYGVTPEQFVDVKALMGDTSDNIPGVPGIGEKTALKYIAEYGSLDGLYEHLNDGAIKGAALTKLTEGKESAYLSQFLAAIKCDVPLGVTLESLSYGGIQREALKPLLTELELTSMIKRLGLDKEEAAAPSDCPSPFLPCGEPVRRPLSEVCEGAYPYAAVSFGDGELRLWDGKESAVLSYGDEAEVKAFLAHNRTLVVADAKALYLAYGRCAAKVFDVTLAAYVCDPSDNTYTLPRLAVKYLGQVLPDGYDEAKALYELAYALNEKLKETEQSALYYQIEEPLSAVLADMERRGFMVDREGLAAFSDELGQMCHDYAEAIYFEAGHEFNINSPKQLGDVLFEELMLPTQKKTKTGYSTNAEVLEKLRKYHPIVEDILEYRQVTKLKSTYVDGLLKVADENGRVHTTFKQTGTATGRLSSAEPNLQNIPIRTELGREMRKFFIPSDESKVLIDADYSQIELRLLAHIAGDSAMQNAFRSRKDIHTDTASRVFGVDPEHVTIDLRKKAKAVNFGILYGMGEFSLAEDLHISRAEAKAYIDNYLSSYPNIARYLEEIIATAYRDGYVTTMAGRRRMIPELAESNKMRKKFGERVAMNSPIQGTAADIIKLAMIRVHKRLQGSGLDARMILQVHDELILEADRACADAAEALLKEEMEHVLELSVPLDVEANTGENWFEAH